MVKAAIARFRRIPLAVADLKSLVVKSSSWTIWDAIGAAFDDLAKDVLHLDVRVDVHPLRR
jgi:hypothetical protein